MPSGRPALDHGLQARQPRNPRRTPQALRSKGEEQGHPAHRRPSRGAARSALLPSFPCRNLEDPGMTVDVVSVKSERLAEPQTGCRANPSGRRSPAGQSLTCDRTQCSIRSPVSCRDGSRQAGQTPPVHSRDGQGRSVAISPRGSSSRMRVPEGVTAFGSSGRTGCIVRRPSPPPGAQGSAPGEGRVLDMRKRDEIHAKCRPPAGGGGRACGDVGAGKGVRRGRAGGEAVARRGER